MLDTETKHRIDEARNILVGKVPDPKSQVEQITIALIYKFMDDMDTEAEDLGGNRKFFSGDFARYGWSKLLNKGIGGHDLITLYGEGIATMPQNPGIPALFRDIFKNAYLPYRDPETLKSFLKIIDEFRYDHSERLGDAFEYLLSILGSQGDAGQFRTPRHIIDFIVEVLAPKKGELILDPACGTAGFLISAYKHILRTNTDKKNTCILTLDEKTQLAQHFKGYDISPDMVRLSLVNLYLHGFTNPQIFEYDTLTSEERWNEFADVILANPPFMSPKGGIKPHKRFSIQAKRSEVLFVDYIAEHLSQTGRAGIIVPEGIIFKKETAYKSLRKTLLENSLVAVISLPGGVFCPYSDVKTSILIFDKLLAKQSDTIAFFKVENDGFSLGAQRRAIEGEQLTQVNRELTEYFKSIQSQQSNKTIKFNLGFIVKKEKIARNGDYNFSESLYKENKARKSSLTTFVYREIKEIANEIKSGFACGQSSIDIQGVPHIRPMNITENGQFTWDGLKQITESDYIGKEEYALKAGDILFNNTNSKELVGKTCFIEHDTHGGFSNHMTRIRVKSELCNPHFLALLLHNAWQKGIFLNLSNKWVGQAGINSTVLSQLQIPVPAIEIQKKIVAEIESYQKIINGALAIVKNYQPQIFIHPNWPMVKLGDLFFKITKSIMPSTLNGPVTYIGLENISQGTSKIIGNITTKNPTDIRSLKTIFQQEDILFGKLRPNLNKVWLADRVGICSTDIFVIRSVGKQVIPAFYKSIFQSNSFNEKVVSQIKGAQLPRVGWSSFSEIEIPLPPVEIQQFIAADLEAEQVLIDANHELICRFEGKIKAILDTLWNDSDKKLLKNE